MLIASTSRDEVNMVCCLTAKKLGVKYTIARIRDYEYAMELTQLKTEMDIDMVINPEHATAMQISPPPFPECTGYRDILPRQN